VYTTPQVKDQTGALNMAKHILNTVNISKGSVEAELKVKDGSKAYLVPFAVLNL
jgi:hypothetical protein